MIKVCIGLALVALVAVSCEKDQGIPDPGDLQDVQVDMSDFTLLADSDDITGKPAGFADKCVTMENLKYRLHKNPGLEQKMYDIEYTTRKAIALKSNGRGKPGGGGGGGSTPPIYTGAVTIPVVVNIIETSFKAVTDAQVTSQINILTDDFNRNNSNASSIPSEFAALNSDVNITFNLDRVIRKTSSKSSWGTNDAMKYASQGGIDATDTSTYLNIWVCEIGGGILGYAQFPGGSETTDGIVIGPKYFGESTAGGIYGHGRTATHEVGHWLNLRHIWGDGRCNRDDYVADTPKSDRANYNCPSYPTVHCNSNDMTMNYMDYVQDDCMYMFTTGQNDRMRALFAAGGARERLVQ